MMDIQTEAFLSALRDALRLPAPAMTGRGTGSFSPLGSSRPSRSPGSPSPSVPLCSRSRSGSAGSSASFLSSAPAVAPAAHLGEHHPALLRARMCQARAALSVALSSGDLAAAIALLDRLTETEGAAS
ncbi:hypothetical protein [Nocardiopsis sp. LDBS1602]|uniref:hypothetical protein n=1 Tax=Nocardiopsis sp. LDBS1602 TaxID=3109597 RepID=UPI002DBEAFA1|nr:hypothetical protein [Nocardiopsis sp. LDBS1602]MEC3892665.1 hypothetical protein [Nocardiopsis sp. LDBS1602]